LLPKEERHQDFKDRPRKVELMKSGRGTLFANTRRAGVHRLLRGPACAVDQEAKGRSNYCRFAGSYWKERRGQSGSLSANLRKRRLLTPKDLKRRTSTRAEESERSGITPQSWKRGGICSAFRETAGLASSYSPRRGGIIRQIADRRRMRKNT